jgi:AcrR family transcriptional regulator
MFAMTYPTYIRDKARELRTEKHLSLDEIAERLALPKTTIYYWVRDLPLGRPRRASAGQRKGSVAMQAGFRVKRRLAYAQGIVEFAELSEDPTFRDFVCLYIAEGSKRNRNQVAVCNSDPAVVRLCTRWIRRFARNPVTFSIQYHADQDLQEITEFWGVQVDVSPAAIRLQRKSNSRQLAGRTWRSQYGVLTVSAGDTYLRARLQAWIDCLRWQWLHSPHAGA